MLICKSQVGIIQSGGTTRLNTPIRMRDSKNWHSDWLETLTGDYPIQGKPQQNAEMGNRKKDGKATKKETDR